MYCQKCGKEISDQASFCPGCGQPVNAPGASSSSSSSSSSSGSTSSARVASLEPGYRADKQVSTKSRLATLLLCFFLGGIGVHRFYVGKVGTGVAMIFTLGGLGIWVLVDFIMIIVGNFKDADGRYVLDWQT
jgi:TM2 domain-containing membrane protein YozV